jgi:hypothetical protein
VIPPALHFLLKFAFDIWGLLYFHMNFRIDFSIFTNEIGILMGHCIESVGCFWWFSY